MIAPLEADDFEVRQDGGLLRLTLRAGDAAMSLLITPERAIVMRDAFAAHAERLNRAADFIDSAAATMGARNRADRRRAEWGLRNG